MKKLAAVFYAAMAVLLFVFGARGQSPAAYPVPTLPTNPSTSTDMFRPVAGFPAPGWPYQPDPACPLVRQSGVYGFTDSRGTATPNDDREYFVACRSDGIFVIDATPNLFYGVTNRIIDATNQVLFFYEPDWRYLGSQPPNWPTAPVNQDTALFLDLNGRTPTGTIAQNYAYCPTYSGPYPSSTSPVTEPWFYPYSTRTTTNREAVVVYEPGSVPLNDKFFVFSINTLHPGVWIIPLRRNQATMLLEADPTAVPNTVNGWWIPGTATYHMIYLDSLRNQIWLTENAGSVRGLQVLAGGSLGSAASPAYIMSYATGGNPHDAMPINNHLFICSTGTSWVDRFNLPITNPNPTGPNQQFQSQPTLNPWITAAHGVYYDPTPMPSASLWLLQEDMDVPASRQNIEQFSFANPTQATTQTAYVQPEPIYLPNTGNPGTPNPDNTLARTGPVHHLRGIGRTGFIAQYNNGFGMVDLSQGGPVVSLMSFKTAFTHYNGVAFPPIRAILDNFLGTWDVYPGQDSGLIYVSGGAIGALVFEARLGHINRYWDASPFAGGGSTNLYPRLSGMYGPPRTGRTYIVRDANSSTYASSTGGNSTTYRYTLCVSSQEPTTSSVLNAPTWPTTFSGNYNNAVTLNLVPGAYAILQQTGNDLFVIPPQSLAAAPRWFVQLFVEEMIASIDGDPAPTGWWAASRGNWLGVAP